MYIPVTSKLHIPDHHHHHTVSSTFPLRRNSTAISIKRSTTPTVPRTVRKNSGEVVRPCLRQRSHTIGGSPQKFVHFGQDLEYVRWFLKAQSPQAVQHDAPSPAPSPIPSETNGMKLTSIRPPTPSSLAVYECWRPVVLEHVEMTNTAWMMGTVKVHNLAFEKSVTVRYSLDNWRNVEETEAQFSKTLQMPHPQAGTHGVDRFQFGFQLPTDTPGLISICVRYNVSGCQYWDNNQGTNYLFKLTRPAVPVIDDEEVVTKTSQTFGKLPTNPPPIARHCNVSMADTRRYMEQSAMLFGGDASVSCDQQSPYMHNYGQSDRQLPLFQDSVWCGGDDFVSTFSTQKYQVFDVDGSLLSRTGSPLAWSSNTQTSALQC